MMEGPEEVDSSSCLILTLQSPCLKYFAQLAWLAHTFVVRVRLLHRLVVLCVCVCVCVCVRVCVCACVCVCVK